MKTNATIGEAAAALLEGLVVRRPIHGDQVIFRQVPSEVAPDIIARMTSLPSAVKRIVQKTGQGITYHNQVAIIRAGRSAQAYTFTVDDIFANDWIIEDGDPTENLPGFVMASETVGTAKPLAPHQQRVVAERDELTERRKKLVEFTVDDIFADDWIIEDGDPTENLPGFVMASETVGTAKPLEG